MPAELDRKTAANGERGEEAAVLPARDSAWHREGTVVPEGHPALTDLDRALEVAGLDWEVAKQPHYVKVTEEPDEGTTGFLSRLGRGTPEPKERLVESADSFSVVRLDRNEVIGTVGSRWQPLQNRDAFAPIRPALEGGLARIETAGSLRNGANVWMLVRFDRDEIFRRVFDDVAEEDVPAERELVEFFAEIAPYGMMFNDHSGSGKARVKETAIRVVCANTLDAGLAEAVGYDAAVSHEGDVEERYREATERIFRNMAERYAALANYRSLFRDTRITDRAFDYLVLDPIAPIHHLERKISRREASPQTHAALERKSEQRDRIRALFEGEGTGIDGEPTAWNGWNAAIEWIDHAEEAAPHTGRVKSLVGGSLRTAKRQSFRNLLDYSRTKDPEERRALVSAARGN